MISGLSLFLEFWLAAALLLWSGMSRTAIEEILELPADTRVQIAQQIWESVAEHPEQVTLTAAQRDELEKRWKAMQESPEAGEDWELLQAKLRSE